MKRKRAEESPSCVASKKLRYDNGTELADDVWNEIFFRVSRTEDLLSLSSVSRGLYESIKVFVVKNRFDLARKTNRFMRSFFPFSHLATGKLDLSFDDEIDDASVSSFSNLTELSLRGNRGITPRGLVAMTNLKKLTISMEREYLGDLFLKLATSLTSLEVDRPIGGEPSFPLEEKTRALRTKPISHLTNLTLLSVSRGSFVHPYDYEKLTNLRTFMEDGHLCECRPGVTILGTALSSVRSLVATSRWWLDPSRGGLNSMTNLTELSIRARHYKGTASTLSSKLEDDHLIRLTNLIKLSVPSRAGTENALKGAFLSHLTKLTYLDISRRYGMNTNEIYALTDLAVLKMSEIKKIDARIFRGLTSLQWLTLNLSTAINANANIFEKMKILTRLEDAGFETEDERTNSCEKSNGCNAGTLRSLSTCIDFAKPCSRFSDYANLSELYLHDVTYREPRSEELKIENLRILSSLGRLKKLVLLGNSFDENGNRNENGRRGLISSESAACEMLENFHSLGVENLQLRCIDGMDDECLKKMTRLKKLVLFDCKRITVSSVSTLVNLNRLTWIFDSGDWDDHPYSHLKSLTNLNRLQLKDLDRQKKKKATKVEAVRGRLNLVRTLHKLDPQCRAGLV